MADNCKMVVFSDKAYNAIIRETFEWDPVETGGILLGHILDNGCWIVLEVLPPGYSEGREGNNVHHEMGYFEYNQRFVNYLANSVATQYKIPLELLGLWHRHPGSMDHFSSTDDGTNATFASQNPNGAISGLVNIDPQFRMTMYYIGHNDIMGRTPRYQKVEVEVGSDLIPEEYFEMKFYGGVNDNLHPFAPSRQSRMFENTSQNEEECLHDEESGGVDIGRIIDEQLKSQRSEECVSCQNSSPEWIRQVAEIFNKLKNYKWISYIFVFLLLVIFCFSVRLFYNGVKRFFTSSFVVHKEKVIEPEASQKNTIVVENDDVETPQEIDNVEPEATND